MLVCLPCRDERTARNQAALGWEPLTMLSSPWTTWTSVGMSAISLRSGPAASPARR